MSRIANRPLTKPSEPHRFADLGQVAAGILFLIIPAFLYAGQRADLRNAQQRIGELEADLMRLHQQRSLLELELQTELDPRALDSRAREISGLVDAEEGQVVHLPRAARSDTDRALLAAVPTDGHR